MITIISATNRKNSVTRQVCTYYQSVIQAHGESTEILDLNELPADFTVSALYENNGKNETFNALTNKVIQGKKFILITPEYNGSFPGVLKAFIDGHPYPSGFAGKKIALVGVSDGIQGGILAMSHLTDILNYLGGHVFATKMKFAGINKIFQDGQFTDDFLVKLIEKQVKEFIEF